MQLKVNEQRLLETIDVSASIGKTEGGGLHRLALSEADQQIRDQFAIWLEEAGLQVRVDDFGNMYGRREGKLPDAPAVALGSHLDTQPTGGRYDGILGVLAALEAVRVLNDEGIVTDHPIEIINFTNEEGARFRPPMLGSGGITEVFEKDFVYQSRDDDGITYEEALQAIGYMGEKKNRLEQVKNFIELHIEQGPVLEKEHKDIGIVGGIQGMSWMTISVTGATDHAGPTPMESRKDALVASSAMILLANELPKQFPGLTATVGKIDNYPNAVNVIPGQTEFTLDVRHQDDQQREQAILFYQEEIQKIAAAYQVTTKMIVDWDSPAVYFSEAVRSAIAKASDELGYTTYPLFSGPGHDAKYMHTVAETGMIFVKSIDGISHNGAEFTSDEDVVKGANVLLAVLVALAGT